MRGGRSGRDSLCFRHGSSMTRHVELFALGALLPNHRDQTQTPDIPAASVHRTAPQRDARTRQDGTGSDPKARGAWQWRGNDGRNSAQPVARSTLPGRTDHDERLGTSLTALVYMRVAVSRALPPEPAARLSAGKTGAAPGVVPGAAVILFARPPTAAVAEAQATDDDKQSSANSHPRHSSRQGGQLAAQSLQYIR